MKLEKPVVVFDLETTGTWIEKDRIIEIAMIKCFPDGRRETFHKRVNPGMPIPPVVTELTGISNEDVQKELPFKDIAKDVVDFIDDSDFAGFNVERFDVPLLMRELSEAGMNFSKKSRKIFDAQKVYHINEKRDLSAAFNFYCNKNLDNAHSALADTQATLEILQSQIERYGSDNKCIKDLQEFKYKKTSEFYDSDRKFRWWNGKLYMMFGKYAKHYSLQEVVQKDPGYLEWIMSANFSEEIKDLVGNALKGQFPEFESE